MISVIIPNFNHARFLDQRIQSVLNQTFQEFELILLDDCSTDESVSILRRYANHPKVSHLVTNDYNSGSPFAQWKKGIELAQGDWVWIAESDDYSDPSFLEHCLNDSRDNIVTVYTNSMNVDEVGMFFGTLDSYYDDVDSKLWIQDFELSSSLFLKQGLLHKNVIPNASAVIFRRQLVSQVDWTNIDKMKKCGDWLFWIMINSHGNIQYIHKPLNYFRTHNKVTRINKTIQDKKLRLFEEIQIRDYIYKYYNLIQREKEFEVLIKLNHVIPFVKLFLLKEYYNTLNRVGWTSVILNTLKIKFEKRFRK